MLASIAVVVYFVVAAISMRIQIHSFPDLQKPNYAKSIMVSLLWPVSVVISIADFLLEMGMD